MGEARRHRALRGLDRLHVLLCRAAEAERVRASHREAEAREAFEAAGAATREAADAWRSAIAGAGFEPLHGRWFGAKVNELAAQEAAARSVLDAAGTATDEARQAVRIGEARRHGVAARLEHSGRKLARERDERLLAAMTERPSFRRSEP